MDYATTSTKSLEFALAGVDTVISTISGDAQIKLIDAAAAARVRRFIPAEFGGPPGLRPHDETNLDNGRRQAIVRLVQHETSSGMEFAVFTCGIFYERFAPGGLAASQLGLSSHISKEGEYVMDYRRRTAQLPYTNTSGNSPTVSMISVKDLAHAVVAALSLSSWPREFRIRGDRMSVRNIVRTAEDVRGKSSSPSAVFALISRIAGRSFETEQHTRQSVASALTYARAVRDQPRETRLRHLIATSEGCFDFTDTNLNQLINFRPERFEEYLERAWRNA